MFGSNTLSLPASFAHEHRPLRLSSEAARSQPAGQCHYQISHPAAEDQICSCQVYQHNRSAPGNVCDCGHSACYHGAKSTRVPEPTYTSTPDLADQIKKLEGMIVAERTRRDTAIAQERERDARLLREALAPFHKNEQVMKKKLEEMQHKLDSALREQLRLRERFMAIHETNMTTKQFAGLETEPTSLNDHQYHIPSPPSTSIQIGDDVPGLTSSDERSSSSSSSRNQTPSETIIAITEPESPRSSGILNLINFPRPVVPAYTVPARPSTQIMMEEPRSSGFLGVDLREHMKARMSCKQSGNASPLLSPKPKITTSSMNMSPPSINRTSIPTSLSRTSLPMNGLMSAGHSYDEVRPSKKRKHRVTNMMALDVLADVSAARQVVS